ncbi:TPA: phosphatase PAP2 family protein [Candidatus Micrarchaeota archaeon]|nr:phosphatase PAP2 family protein [Candidatus Micrarchaeota archaeon]
MVNSLLDAVSILFNSEWGFIAFCIISLLLFYLFSKHRKVFFLSLLIAASLGIGLKVFIAQPRPCVDLESKVLCPASFGFPSDHAVVATVFLLGALGSFLFPYYAAFAIIIFFSRLWLGVHTFPQVAGGFALGALVFLVVFQLNQKFFGSYSSKIDLDGLFEENLLTKRVE